MPRPPIAPVLAFSLVLAACGSERASAPGGVSAGEAEALEDAASMLDERSLPPDALPPEADPAAAPTELTGDSAPARN
jgi:hypothetical protein